MSTNLKSLVIRNPHLKLAPKFTLHCLADYSGATGIIFPSYETIAKYIGSTRRTAINSINFLISNGYLAKRKRIKNVDGKSKNSSNLYRINYELLKKEAEPITEPTECNNLFPEFNDSEKLDPIPPSEKYSPPSEKYSPPQCKIFTHNYSLNPLLNKKENKQKKKSTSLRPKVAVPAVKEIFEYWQKATNHPRAKLDAERVRLISKALEDYEVDDIKQAIDGCAQDKWHMEKGHNSIGLILRNADKIESFMNMGNVLAPKKPSAEDQYAHLVITPRAHKTEQETKQELEQQMPRTRANPDHVSSLVASVRENLGKQNMETRNVRNNGRGVISTAEQRYRDGSEDVITPRSSETERMVRGFSAGGGG